MKKISLYMAAALVCGLASCTEDYVVEGAQTNAQEAILQASDVTVTPLMTSAIDINSLLDENGDDASTIKLGEVTVKEGALTDGVTLQSKIQVSTSEDFSNPMNFDGESMDDGKTIALSPKALQEAYFQNVTHSPKAKTLYVRSMVQTVTNGTSVAYVGAPEYYTKGSVNFTPKDMGIVLETAYYYLGSLATDQTYKLTNSGADPYDDPVFSVTVPALGEGWHWFKIAPESAYNADGTMNWDNEMSCICPMTGDATDMSGKCQNGKLSWHLVEDPANAAYKITVNVMDMTYEIQGISAIPEYYGVGTMTGWNAGSKVSAMFPTSGNTITLTTYFTGAWDMRMWPAENFGNWDSGTAIGIAENGGNAASGTLVWNTENDGNLASPEAGYYTLDCNLGDMTYQWTKCDNQSPATYEKIGLVGGNDDWDNDVFLTQVENTSGADHPTHLWYALGVKIDFCSWGVQFRANGGWDQQWGSGDQGFPYAQSNTKNNISIEPGTYNVYFNDITGHYFFVAQ